MTPAEEINLAADVLNERDGSEAALTAGLLRSCAEEWAETGRHNAAAAALGQEPYAVDEFMDDALALARHINAQEG